MRLFTNAIFIALSTLAAPFAQGASCCGGGFASPTIITGDELATFTGELSHSNIATEVSSQGIWQDRKSPENLETLKLQGAHIFRDRYQVGASAPLISRTRAGSSSTGLGDVGLNLGYEILPEWDYSPWRPRGVSYLSLVLPTGRAIQDSTDAFQLDARGRGYWAVGLGTTLTKIIGRFDFVGTLEVHRSFAREVKNSDLEGELVPGFGGLLATGAGFNFKDSRVGASLGFNYEDPVEMRGLVASLGSPVRFATATVTASQMFGEAWAASISVFDQSLFGAPTNTNLARGLSVSLQHRLKR